MIRRQTAAVFDAVAVAERPAGEEDSGGAVRGGRNPGGGPNASPQLRPSQAVKYELKPLSSATKAPWASALQVKYAGLMDSAEGTTAVELMQTGLAPKTAQNYDSKLAKFISFCAERGLSPMPATTETVLRYIGYLATEGTVHVDSAQPYLSCINTAHVAVGLDPPALGSAVEQARKGWRQRIVQSGPLRGKRVPLPPQVAEMILAHGVQIVARGRYRSDRDEERQLRDVVAVLVTYLFFGRSDTGFAAETFEGVPDVQVHGTDLVFYERRFKGSAAGSQKRTLRYPLAGKRDLLRVISAFLDVAPATSGYTWRLPQDGKKWNSTVIDDMLQRVLTVLGVEAPEGYSYSSHSLRSGAASAAFAVGVDIIRICYCGGWAQGSQAVHHYIDPSWQASTAAEFFFGHLRHSGPQYIGNR